MDEVIGAFKLIAFCVAFGVVVGIAILVVSFINTVFDCEVCGVEFSERAQKHPLEHQGKNLTICTQCKNKINKKKSSEGFDAFFKKGGAEGVLGVEESSGPLKVDVRGMDIPSSDKIKLVAIKPLKIKDGDLIKASRVHKRYSINVTPQLPGLFEYDSEKTVNVFVLAGSKDEAFNALSNHLTGKYAFLGRKKPNSAECGEWYGGDKCLFILLGFEKEA